LGRGGLGGGTDSFFPVLAEAVTSEAIEVSEDVIGSPSPDHPMVRPRGALRSLKNSVERMRYSSREMVVVRGKEAIP
jgi:hypothetical protein